MFVVEIEVDQSVDGPLHGELVALVADALAARAPGYAQKVRVSWRDPEHPPRPLCPCGWTRPCRPGDCGMESR